MPLGSIPLRMLTIFAMGVKPQSVVFVCLFVCVEFYRQVNPMGSCRARSVYLTTRLLGRLSPPSG